MRNARRKAASGEKRQSAWVALETKYRQTLLDTRWLRHCNYEVHHFTNDEILELYDPDEQKNPDVDGFVRLLRTEGLEPEEMVFLSLVKKNRPNIGHEETV